MDNWNLNIKYDMKRCMNGTIRVKGGVESDRCNVGASLFGFWFDGCSLHRN